MQLTNVFAGLLLASLQVAAQPLVVSNGLILSPFRNNAPEVNATSFNSAWLEAEKNYKIILQDLKKNSTSAEGKKAVQLLRTELNSIIRQASQFEQASAFHLPRVFGVSKQVSNGGASSSAEAVATSAAA